MVSSIVCLLILLNVAERLDSLLSSLKVSNAFLIDVSFLAMASRRAAGMEVKEEVEVLVTGYEG